MLGLLLTIIAVIIILLLNETWWRIRKPNNETSRKTAHILIGSFVAFWPYFLSRLDIIILGLSFFILVSFGMYFKLFDKFRTVTRPTYGELLFSLSVVIISIITTDKLIYLTAILSMGLADGIAAIFSSHFGKSTSFSIFGFTKSLVGSLAFYIMILLLLANYADRVNHPVDGIFYLGLALTVTVLENISIAGIDNLTVPLLITVWLKLI